MNVFLYDGAIVPDPDGIITGGHDNKTARTVAIRQGEKVPARALLTMLKRIIVNNRAGGWRKAKARASSSETHGWESRVSNSGAIHTGVINDHLMLTRCG